MTCHELLAVPDLLAWDVMRVLQWRPRDASAPRLQACYLPVSSDRLDPRRRPLIGEMIKVRFVRRAGHGEPFPGQALYSAADYPVLRERLIPEQDLLTL